MSRFILNKAGLLSVIFLSALFILYFYSPVLFDPSAFILNDKGDALKNYYCYQWHVMHDESFIHYTGTNYPFGEHHFYCDGNPLLSNIIKALPFLAGVSIGIYNLSLFLSLVACAVLLYKIFRLLAVTELFAVIAAIGVTILCPQVFRLPGHMSLSYGFAIPLTIYLLLKYEQKKNATVHTALLSILLFCLLLIHPYLGMICTAFVFAYWLFSIIANIKASRPQLLPFLIQSVVPVSAYLLLLKFTDTHTDRVSQPYGFLYYTSSIETVFISTHPPFRHFMSQVYKIKSQSWEGLAYIGLPSVLCILSMPFFVFKSGDMLKRQYRASSNARTLVHMMASSIVLLLFSMAIPFKWNMEWLLDDLPFIQQFRAPGRYAWVFYFMATIGSVIIISKYFLAGINKYLRMIVCSFVLLLYSIEGVPYHASTSQRLFVKNPFDYNNIDEELRSITASIKGKNAQAIIPLPFFHVGTDHYSLTGSEQIKRAAFIVSYHTTLPLMAGFTPRTSLTESAMMIQAIESPGEENPIRKYINEGRTFIILASKEPIREEEKRLISKGKLIVETDHYFVRELTPEEFFTE